MHRPLSCFSLGIDIPNVQDSSTDDDWAILHNFEIQF